MMRVMSALCCITAIIIALIGVLYKNPTDYSGTAMLCGTFLSMAFGGKCVQKMIETKTDVTESKTIL
jgi:hypothetical protein